MHCNVPLTPTTFLERSGHAHPDRVAVAHPGGEITFAELLNRARRLAQALVQLGIRHGDRVCVLCDNSLQMLEVHFAIPAAGASIVALNPWLTSADLARQIRYCGARMAIVGDAFLGAHAEVFGAASELEHVILVGGSSRLCQGGPETIDYDVCLKGADDSVPLDRLVASELDPIAINFTSGTTGAPKGVVISHRAAYLHAVGQVLMLELTGASRYLWSLPMFHVNGWGHMWAAAAVAAPQIVASQRIDASVDLLAEIHRHRPSHMAGAPRLLRNLLNARGDTSILRGFTMVTGGAAPSPVMIARFEELGIRLIHQYGLNETCGPYVVCEEQDAWTRLDRDARVAKRLRQGVPAIHAGTGLRVVDGDGLDVPADGNTLGEIIMAGNTVATGYFNNPEATDRVFVDGWFHSGDVAVMHPDGYLEIKDRLKDLIYVETAYGWENISSIEVENVIGRHPAVTDVAVVGLPERASGQSRGAQIVAFLETGAAGAVSDEDLHRYCEAHLADYKRPDLFFFRELPKTATGKVRKDILVEEACVRIDLMRPGDGEPLSGGAGPSVPC